MTEADQIASAFGHPDVCVVSFDIFDTLLERPSLHPHDIFILLQAKVQSLLGRKRFDFFKARRRIEDEAVVAASGGKELDYTLSFSQIYDFFGKKYGIPQAQLSEIMGLELALERQLLTVRPAGKQLYDAAVSAGKRIICVSDMYHDSAFLGSVLAERGYQGVEVVYVSSEIKKRKDSGALFRHVLATEGLTPHQLIHVGDNRSSDHAIPIQLGIPAFHLPSSLEYFRSSPTACRDVWTSNDSPVESLVIGCAINRWAALPEPRSACFPTPDAMGYFGIGPVLFAIAQYLRLNRDIQSRYSVVHFASRDGFLPIQAYEALCSSSSRPARPARYIYCGRSLYYAVNYQGDPLKYLVERLRNDWANPEMTVGDLFDSLVEPGFLAEEDPRRETCVATDGSDGYPDLKAIIEERGSAVDAVLQRKHRNVAEYYSQQLDCSPNQRAVIFDCGYSGSVSTNIMKAAGKRVDKVYLCKTRLNDMRDLRNRTRTYLLLGKLTDMQPMGTVNVFEEIFAAPENQCIDIVPDEQGFKPVFDEVRKLSDATCSDLAVLQKAAMRFVTEIQSQFGEYLDCMDFDQIGFATEPLLTALRSPTDPSVRQFENICFPDSFFGDDRSLSEKVEPQDREHLLRTPFVDPACTVTTPDPTDVEPANRLAIHLHLFHPDAAGIFTSRLAALPRSFDLYISVCREHDVPLARVLFTGALAHRLGKLEVRRFPNRGRDVGAWVVGFGKELMHYDLVAHLHTKKSTHFPWGEAWRDYLLDNLIGADAFRDIERHFASDPKLGLLFPPIYRPVFEMWGGSNLPQLEEVDRKNCLELMGRLGVQGPLSKHSLLFPAGDMLWYRPQALAPLMDGSLTFEDFPEEPIGITGTLAHAVERLSAVIAAAQGYSARCYIRRRELLEHYAAVRLGSITVQTPARRAAGLARHMAFRISWLALKLLPPGTSRHRIVRKWFLKCMALVR